MELGNSVLLEDKMSPSGYDVYFTASTRETVILNRVLWENGKNTSYDRFIVSLFFFLPDVKARAGNGWKTTSYTRMHETSYCAVMLSSGAQMILQCLCIFQSTCNGTIRPTDKYCSLTPYQKYFTCSINPAAQSLTQAHKTHSTTPSKYVHYLGAVYNTTCLMTLCCFYAFVGTMKLVLLRGLQGGSGSGFLIVPTAPVVSKHEKVGEAAHK